MQTIIYYITWAGNWIGFGAGITIMIIIITIITRVHFTVTV